MLECSGIGDIDYTAAETLQEAAAMLKEKGVRFAMSEVIDEVRAELVASALLAEIGEDAIFDTLPQAIAAFEARGEMGSSRGAGKESSDQAS